MPATCDCHNADRHFHEIPGESWPVDGPGKHILHLQNRDTVQSSLKNFCYRTPLLDLPKSTESASRSGIQLREFNEPYSDYPRVVVCDVVTVPSAAIFLVKPSGAI